MKIRREWWWWVIAAFYVGAVLSLMPEIERFFSPFVFHVLRGPR
jgi:hypothetical protein